MFKKLFGPPDVPTLLKRRDVPRLIKTLSSEEQAERDAAANALVTIGPDASRALIDVLRNATRGYSYESRAALKALESVAPCADTDALAPLVECLAHEEHDIAWAAVRLFEKLGARMAPILIRALGRPERHVRERAAFALGEIGDPSAAAPIAAALLADREFAKLPVRTSVHPLAEALVKLPAPSLAAQLAQGLPSSDAAIRTSIIHVLSQSSDASLAALVTPYLHDTDPGMRAQAAKLIGRSRDASRGAELLEALERELPAGHIDATTAVIEALGGLREPRAVCPLLDALSAADIRIVAAAAAALGAIGDPAAVERLIGLLDSQEARLGNGSAHFELIKATMFALAKLGDPRGAEAVARRLTSRISYDVGDRDDRETFYPVAEMAREALADSDRGRQRLVEMLKAGEGNYYFRASIAQALAKGASYPSVIEALEGFVVELRAANDWRHLPTAEAALAQVKPKQV